MADPLAGNEDNEPDEALVLPRVTVRYWAAARAAAGVDEETLPGKTVAEVLAAAVLAHYEDQRFERVLHISSILVGDRPVGARPLESVVLAPGDVLQILPPFAGG